MSGRRIAVLGAGANGASIGADLTLAGEDVLLVEQWPAHVEMMRANGLHIRTPAESLQLPVKAIHLCEIAELRHRFDYVLMLMKAYDSRWAAQLIEPYLEPDGMLVGVQNGMTIDVISDVVGVHRTLGCVIEITSAMFEPGVVERHSGRDRSWFAIGSLDAATHGREEEVAALLRHSGKVEVVQDIRATKWMKLVSNATTLVTTAALGLSMVDAAEIPEARALMLRCGQEALEATIALGNPVLPIFGLTAEHLGRQATVVEILLETLLSGFVLPDSKTTVLQDWIKGRRSEVDELNGLVAATHRQLGRRAVANEAIVEIAHRIERAELEPEPANLALIAGLLDAAEAVAVQV